MNWVESLPSTKSAPRGSCRWSGIEVCTPSIRNIESARFARADRLAPVARRTRSAWRSASRSTAGSRSRGRCGCRSAPRARPGSASSVISPGDGANVTGSSALMRNSIACPTIARPPADRQRLRRRRSAAARCTRSTPGHRLGHRVLDLDAGVHLHEVELRRRRRGTRPCRRSRSRPPRRRCDRGLAHPLAQLRVDDRRGRLLDQLLVAALDRALALAERHHPAAACRPAPGPRCGAARSGTSRGRRRPRRTPARPRGARCRRRGAARAASRATRIPLPPPPAEALRITGKPICSASATASSREASGSEEPGQHRHAARGHRAPGVGLVAHQRGSPRAAARSRSGRTPARPRRSARSRRGSRSRGGSRRRR